MKDAVRRIGAIVAADFLIRFRRWSTAIVFLLLGASATLWVPDPSTGRALIVIDGRRAVYSSGTIGMGTASLATLFIGLVGFYVVSNAFRRDVETRCGFVIASTPMRNVEYLAGKLLGNVVFLVTFTAGYVAVSMAALVVRREAPLEPLVFLWQYVLLVPPALVMVAMLAVVFESVRWLSGRLGDVVYFFVWLTGMTAVAIVLEQGGPGFVRYLDFSGFGFMISGLEGSLKTTGVSIGASDFDPRKPTIAFQGLTLTRDWVLPRLTAVFLPLLLLPLALRSFHRFDPDRVRTGLSSGRRWHLAPLRRLLRPMVRALSVLRSGGRPRCVSLWGAARHDAYLTLAAAPVSLLGLAGVVLASLLGDARAVRSSVLPVALACVALLLADVPCREARSGTSTLVWAAPLLRVRFVEWKLLTALLLAAPFVAVPLVRTAVHAPRAAASLVVGTAFLCAAATGLGVLSSNPKALVVAFLSFLYIVVNDGGRTPALDFAGFYGTATPLVTLTYAMLAAGFAAAGLSVHRWRTRREEAG